MNFDPENHLTGVPGMMQAGYDSDDLRAWKQGASPQGPMPATYFLYDGDTALLEEDSAGNVLAWNGYGADGLRTRYTTNPVGGANQTIHYAYDPSGNLANRLDPNGVASNTTVFDAFGALRGQINTATGQPEVNPDPVGFSGQWGAYTDPETKLVLMTHRYYDPSHGRWLNRDPIGYGGGVNLYGYCGNNPVTWVDPDGFGPVPGAGLPNGYCGKQRLNPDAAQMINDAINAQPYADALGWLPGVPGILGNGFSALVSVGKGEYGAAAGSVAAMIPFERALSRFRVFQVTGKLTRTGKKWFRKQARQIFNAVAGWNPPFVHHRFPLAYAHLLPHGYNPNMIGNLAGVSERTHVATEAEWEQFRRSLGGREPTLDQVIQKVQEVDKKFGGEMHRISH